MKRPIYVHPSVNALDPRLKDALERLAPVRFEDCGDIAARRAGDVVLSLSGEAAALADLSQSPLIYFHAPERNVPRRSETKTEIVRFSESGHLEALLRNRRLPQRKLDDFVPVAVKEGDEVLAEYAGQPIWVARSSSHGAGNIVSAPLPRFAGNEHALDYLNGFDFILLLPLLHFLRGVCAQWAWTAPKLRACLTFDDPNLHWLTYGCLSYREIVERAQRDRFHVSIATVPLDAWMAHPRAASLFRENAAHLSLLMHGNNHTREEYGQDRDPDAQLALVVQSLERIKRLERATGLHVDRAIVPPHEALTETAASAMLALGLEGASLATWSLRHWSRGRLPASFGVEMADMSVQGFACLGRYALREDCEAPAIISAFLGRPMVFVGHHKAVSQGHDLLSAVASVVNSLGDVEWCGVEALLRSNYLQRRAGRTLYVRPCSSRIQLVVPDGVEEIRLDADLFPTPFRLVRGSKTGTQGDGAQPDAFTVTPGERVEFVSPLLGAARERPAQHTTLSFPALARRFACEARDRWEGYQARIRNGQAAL